MPPALVEHFPILEMDSLGIILVDKFGAVKYCNQTVLSHLGYSPEKVEQLSIFSINPHMSLLAWKKNWKRLALKSEIVVETEFINGQGVIYPVITKSRLFKAGKDRFCYMLVENQLEANRYKDLLYLMAKISKMGSWEYDLVNRKVILNKELLPLFGEAPGEQVLSIRAFFRLCQSYLSKSELRALLKTINTTSRKGNNFDLEILIRTAKDGVKAFRLLGKPLYLEDQPSKIYGLLQDISSITVRSEEMYLSKFTIDHTREAIVWIKHDGSIHYVNNRSCKLLEYTRIELDQKTVFDIDIDLKEENWQRYWDQFREKEHDILERTYLTKSGEQIPVSASINYLTYQDQEFLCVFVRDLRYRRMRDKFLKIHSFTLNQSSDIFFWIDQQGNVLYHNKATLDKLGYTASEFESMNIFKLQQTHNPQNFKAYWDTLREKRYTESGYEVNRKDGTSFPVEALVTYIEYQDEKFACFSWRDISERKKREKKLQKAYQEIKDLKEKIQQENTFLQREVARDFNFNKIVSKSKAYQGILRQVAQVADTNATVLIQGETGTGKELLASAVHNLSERDEKNLVKVNCAALPAALIESELFGHEKGAFTGAYQRKIGRFELADQGSIFLDEIGEVPIELQPKLLRVLQEGEFERVGGNETIKVDVRIIAATNRDLKKLIGLGQFREDLYYRLNVFPIYNLPLRERREDIVPLIQHFMHKFSEGAKRKITEIRQSDINLLLTYSFPGNIRELENIVERAVILSQSEILNLKSVLHTLREQTGADAKLEGGFISFAEMQKAHIIEALKRTQWRVSGQKGAAKLLGMNDKTLASKMRKLKISRENYLDL